MLAEAMSAMCWGIAARGGLVADLMGGAAFLQWRGGLAAIVLVAAIIGLSRRGTSRSQ